MFKAAFFDVDWTLYDHEQHKYIESGIEAIKRIKEKGIKVFVCSARPFDSLDKFGVFNLGIDWDGYIGSAGSIAVVREKIVYKSLMNKQDVKKFLKYCDKYNLCAEIILPQGRLLYGKPNEYVEKYYGVYADTLPEEGEVGDKEVTGALLFAPEEFDKELEEILPNLIYYRFFETGLDVMPRLHKKGFAIKKILEEIGVKPSEAIGFGDDTQDITMKEGLDTLVCMGNGKDDVKEAADFVTKEISEDGLAFAIEKYLLD
ncbi:MAG: HAD-IIB family hydrolase [Bacilli bacterium]|nr:HAD-IIB family hydrolase [Bacilli bacterium]MDY6430234.1 HAD-IIB family hydrolase [Bacilli bacterium]